MGFAWCEDGESDRMPHKKGQSKKGEVIAGSVFVQAMRARTTPGPTVSGRWLLTAASLAILGAGACAWGALCLLFWQGSWQLLYHPVSAVTSTPASLGLAFDSVGFATTEAGEPQLKGWWIPAAADARYGRDTVLYLHGQKGNLGDTVDELAALHDLGMNVLAFDYRGYGQSEFQRPSEARWREDAESALAYLTGTRHVAAGAIVVVGKELGANLALEIAAAHPELAGVVLESPMDEPVQLIFGDARARMVPAHGLVRDRFDSDGPATALKVPSLWFVRAGGEHSGEPEAFRQVAAAKMLVWLKAGSDKRDFADSLARWLDDLPEGQMTDYR
jgi:pimeloyl-ACP methyl ester carboxylesterase